MPQTGDRNFSSMNKYSCSPSPSSMQFQNLTKEMNLLSSSTLSPSASPWTGRAQSNTYIHTQSQVQAQTQGQTQVMNTVPSPPRTI